MSHGQSFVLFPTEASAKRTADHHEDPVTGSSKKARVSLDVPVLTEEPASIDMEVASSVEDASTAVVLPSTPVVTTSPPPPPPRSPSPPRHKPSVPSPLSPPPTNLHSLSQTSPDDLSMIYSSSSPQSRPPRRPRSRSTEIALLKFALDPWLRLSRTLDSSSTAAAVKASCRPGMSVSAFNPATYPSTGNLRELRVQACDPFHAPRGRIATGGHHGMSFSFGEPTVKWSLVDA